MKFLITTIIAFISARTIIVPKTLLNHRLSLSEGARAINSALNNETLEQDKFLIPTDFTFLTSGENALCYETKSKGAHVCEKDEKRKPWKIVDSIRESRFRDINGNCVTIGPHNDSNDSYDLIMTPCDTKNLNQLFILNVEHGKPKVDTIEVEVTNSEVYLGKDPKDKHAEDGPTKVGSNKKDTEEGRSAADKMFENDKHKRDINKENEQPHVFMHGDGEGNLI